MKNLVSILTFASLITFSTCSEDAFEPSCGSTAYSFTTDVKPITDSKCATNSGCHGSGSSRGVYTSYNSIFNDRTKIAAAIKNGSMPKSGSLTTSQKNAILCWIESGAANN